MTSRTVFNKSSLRRWWRRLCWNYWGVALVMSHFKIGSIVSGDPQNRFTLWIWILTVVHYFPDCSKTDINSNGTTNIQTDPIASWWWKWIWSKRLGRCCPIKGGIQFFPTIRYIDNFVSTPWNMPWNVKRFRFFQIHHAIILKRHCLSTSPSTHFVDSISSTQTILTTLRNKTNYAFLLKLTDLKYLLLLDSL